MGDVSIVLPRVGIEYLVTVARETNNRKWAQVRSYYKVMGSRSEKIGGLQRGKTYRLCVCVPQECDGDRMCGVVSVVAVTTTAPPVATTTLGEIDVVQPKIIDQLEEGENEETDAKISLDVESQQVEGLDQSGESSYLDEPSVYLIVGAVVSLLIIFVFASFILIFNRRKRKEIAMETGRRRELRHHPGCHGDETEMVAMRVGDDLGCHDDYERPVTSFNNNYDVTLQKGSYRPVGCHDKRLRHHSEQFVSMTPMATTVMRARDPPLSRGYHTMSPHSAFRGNMGSLRGNQELPSNYFPPNLQQSFEGYRTLRHNDEIIEV